MMKTKFFLKCFALGTFLSAHQSFAEEVQYEEEEYNTIKTDGQLVPVGEKNRYRLTYNTWNVWTNPFTWFVGSYGVGVSYAFHPNFKVNLAPEFTYTFNRDDRLIGGGATLSTSIFFNRVYDGFYLEPGMRVSALSEKGSDDDEIIAGPQLIGGWGWIWDSGFTVNAGLGIGYSWTSDDDFDSSYYDGLYAAGNLQFGFTF